MHGAVWLGLAGVLVLHASEAVAGALPQNCLVYVISESSASDFGNKNLKDVADCLRRQADEELTRVADRLIEDQRLCRAALDIDRSGIEFLLDADQTLEAFLFSNEAARRGKCESFDRAKRQFIEVDFEIARDPDPILSDNPLSHPAALQAVLAHVAGRFPGRRLEVDLVLKGHGTGVEIMRPLISVDASSIECSDLVQKAREFKKAQKGIADRKSMGLSKGTLLDMLRESGEKHSLRFPVVFLESCNAALPEQFVDRVPECVDHLCYLDRPTARYVNVLWGDLVPLSRSDRSFSERLLTELKRKCSDVTNEPRPRTLAQRAMYYAPLGVCLALIGRSLIKRRQKA